MKTVGIIAEYNPFHKGHAYQLQKAKELAGADYAVIVLSGNFVQRGLPALADKYVRTEMALHAGADLVVELPCAYAVGSAEAFAQGAVSVLNALGCVDVLCFGSEAGQLDAILPYARLFEEEPPLYRSLLKENLKSGRSFPSARREAAETYFQLTERIFPCCAEDADLKQAKFSPLDEPNNILGIEYCRALLHQKSAIRPLTLPRRSSGYHSLCLDTEMASATAIRHAILTGRNEKQAAYSQLPEYAGRLLKKALLDASPVTLDDFSSILSYRLLSLKKEELASFEDVGEELAARIEKLRFQFTGAQAFADLVKTRRFTHTRITRALCHILLDLRQEDADERKEQGWPVYLRALGFRKSASPLLGAVKEKSAVPLLVKAADASGVLSQKQLRLFEQDVFAAHLYEAVRAGRQRVPLIHEYTRSPVILP